MKKTNSLYLAILTFLLALLWLVTTAWSRLHESTIPPDIEKIAAPLPGPVDKSIFTKLEQRAR